jgi:hypothetical protein
MPPIQLPLVKPEIGTNVFVCPRCGERCKTHVSFVEHWTAEHVPRMTPPQRGPVATPAPSPKTVGGAEVDCPICARRFPGGDYPAHARLHAGGGISASQFNQEEPR